MNELERIYYRGDYQALVDATVDNCPSVLDASNLHLVVGALSFLGRLDDAQGIVESGSWSSLSPEQKSEARFYQAVAMCRHSFYEKATQLFFKNFRLGRHGSSRQRYFGLQGLGFLAYFRGRYGQAARLVRLAAVQALASGFTYGRALAEDLKGHSLVQVGQIRAGLKAIALAEKLARRLGSGGFIRATQISQKLYEAQHGLLSNPINELEELVQQGHTHNNYSNTNLYLELANQHMLRGQLKLAEEVLKNASTLVHGSGHRRNIATYGLRMAMLNLQKGRLSQAKITAETALSKLQPKWDLALELQLLETLQQIQIKLGKSLGELRSNRLKHLRHKVDSAVSWRQARRGKEYAVKGAQPLGEDVLGDLLDMAHEGQPEAIDAIIASGYWGLLPTALGISIESQSICLDGLGDDIVIVDRGSVHVAENAQTPNIRQLIQILMTGTHDKETIVEQLWGYQYNPLRHDPLLYRLVSRCRSALGPFREWLVHTDNSYGLQNGVQVLNMRQQKTNTFLKTQIRPEALFSKENIQTPRPVFTENFQQHNHLSLRQIKTIADLAIGAVINPKQYRQLHKISSATARRDLSALVNLGYLQKQGMARATQYICIAQNLS